MENLAAEFNSEQKAWFCSLLAHVLTIRELPPTFAEDFSKRSEAFCQQQEQRNRWIALAIKKELPPIEEIDGVDAALKNQVITTLIIEAANYGGMNAATKVFLRRMAIKLNLTETAFDLLFRQAAKEQGGFPKAGQQQSKLLKSVFVQNFHCKVCSSKVPFYRVKNRTQTTATSPFGIPHYRGAREGFEAADFNNTRVLVCPKCFFSSMTPHLFDHEREDVQPDIQLSQDFQKVWQQQYKRCEQLLSPVKDNLFQVDRSIRTALVTYKLGIHTHKLLCKDDPKCALYQRYLVAQQLQVAEILFSQNKTEEAIKQLQQASNTLNNFVFRLKTEESILPAKLAFLLSIYFENTSHASGYLNMLESLAKKEMHRLSKEGRKKLNRAIQEVNRVWDDRKIFQETVESFYANLQQ